MVIYHPYYPNEIDVASSDNAGSVKWDKKKIKPLTALEMTVISVWSAI